jgi:conjugal transfer/entry exclusion protein
MKRLFKMLARSLWRISAPISRPIIRKFDQHMMHLLACYSTRVDTPANLDLALSSVVRELARLQFQVEVLQQQIDELQAIVQEASHLKSRLSVVAETG